MKYTKKFTAMLKPSCYTFAFNWLESHNVNSTEASDLILSQSQNNFIEVFLEHDFFFFLGKTTIPSARNLNYTYEPTPRYFNCMKRYITRTD